MFDGMIFSPSILKSTGLALAASRALDSAMPDEELLGPVVNHEDTLRQLLCVGGDPGMTRALMRLVNGAPLGPPPHVEPDPLPTQAVLRAAS